MEELPVGTLVFMIKNEDGTYSPVGVNKEQAYFINLALSELSNNNAFIIRSKEKYVQAT